MFKETDAFNQDISSWIPSSVIQMLRMFSTATAFMNQDLSSWNVSHVPDTDTARGYFFENIDGLNGSNDNGNIEPIWQ
jgi:hypothetical protein